MASDFPNMRLTRRGFLGSVAMTSAALALASLPLPATAETIEANRFLALSERLTCHSPLDAGMAARALAALVAVDPAFARRAAELDQVMARESFTDMSAFDQFAKRHENLRPVAMAIISAWYLGYTGTPEGESNHDNAQFVAYETALMYKPTLDATTVPTFSRGHTNYWADPPATLATD